MKILVRLPNWLGDMVMSVGLIQQLHFFFPDAEVSVVAKKGIHELLSFFPPLQHQFIFSKEEHNGVRGAAAFGKQIRQTEKFDLFICLPNSFSTALVGYFSGAEKRIGYKNELRQVLLTDSFPRPEGIHRADEYIRLLELYTNQQARPQGIFLQHSFQKQNYVVVNINSEASSRRLTVPKAVELLNALRNHIETKIVLIGAPKEKEFVATVLSLLSNPANFENLAGKTSLIQLVEILASAQLMLTTDSGPAHLANALGIHTIVLFGAGNENNTAPYNKNLRSVIRLGELTCEPCEKNVCVLYKTPQCLERLNSNLISKTAQFYLD